LKKKRYKKEGKEDERFCKSKCTLQMEENKKNARLWNKEIYKERGLLSY